MDSGFVQYLLYDKIYREDILRHAYDLARANAGAPGVDGMSFAMIEAAGWEEWISGLGTDLIEKTYRPEPVRRVLSPKPGGGERPLGIPTIRDRVVQTAAKLVLEPIFEADLDPAAYGYRPERDRRDQGGARLAVPRLHRCGGRRSVQVLRHDPASRADAVGGASHCRPERAAADQAVADGTGRRARRRRDAAHDGRQGQPLRHAARRGHQPVARQPVHEPLPEALAAQRTRRDLSRPCDLLRRRLHDPEPRPRGRRPGVDEGGDDAARARPQRGEDRDPGRPARALRLPRLYVRPAPLPEGRPLVPGRESVEEERAAAQGEGQRGARTRQCGSLARGARSAQPLVAGLDGVLRLRHPPAGVSRDRQSRLRAGPSLVRRHKVPS